MLLKSLTNNEDHYAYGCCSEIYITVIDATYILQVVPLGTTCFLVKENQQSDEAVR